MQFNFICNSTVVVKKECFDKVGEFDETILDNSELTSVTFFLINLHDGIEAFCPYLQDIEADDWMIVED